MAETAAVHARDIGCNQLALARRQRRWASHQLVTVRAKLLEEFRIGTSQIRERGIFRE